MLQLVLDTSVTLKWVLTSEKDSQIALKIKDFHANSELEIVIPNFALVEIANVLSQSYKLDISQVDEFLSILELLKVKRPYDDKKLLKHALEIADFNKVAVYDSLFLALAYKVNCLLITADNKFIRKIKKDESHISLLENCKDNYLLKTLNWK